jgi:hypothetical protein
MNSFRSAWPRSSPGCLKLIDRRSETPKLAPTRAPWPELYSQSNWYKRLVRPRISRGEPTAAVPPYNTHRCLFTSGNEFALDQVIGRVDARLTEALRLNDA